MLHSCLADRLGDLVDLTASERSALAALEQRERPLRRGALLLRENDKLADLYILRRGMLMSYVLLQDGSRQILRFLFPGDVIAMSALVHRKSPETIAALTARTRVAALLIEVRDRLRSTDPSIGDSFTLALTQEEIGDATGLTAVHVNRMLRKLEEDGVIRRENGKVTFVDEDRIAQGARSDRVDGVDLSWLPAAR